MEHTDSKRKVLTLIIPLIAVATLLVMVAWMAGAFTDKVVPGLSQTQTQAQARTIDTSQTIAVVRVERQRYEPVPASLQAKQASIISYRILARIQKIHVRAGDSIRKGQLLIELEKTDLQARVSQAQAHTESVNARSTQARQELDRTIELNKKGVFAKADLDQAQANHNALVADLTRAQQALQEAQTSLSFAQVRSPMEGRVVDCFAEPGDTAQPGVKLLSLYNPLSVRVEANVREKLALSLRLNQRLKVIVPASDKHIEAEIEELVPAGNPGSRSFLVKSRLQYTEGLLPGMYARILIPAGIESMLLVPEDRVAKVDQLNVVWILENGISERRFIRIGKKIETGLVEVVSGLTEGDRVLLVPKS